MASDVLQTTHAKVIRTTRGAEYYALVHWRKADFDVLVTDGSQSWTKKETRAPASFKAGEAIWMEQARKALCSQAPDPGMSFDVDLSTYGDGQSFLQISWMWKQDSGYSLRGKVELEPATDAQASIRSILRIVITSYGLLMDTVAALKEQGSRLSADLLSTQQSLAKSEQDRSEREADLYVKFSVLLNSKKQHLRQLKEQLEEKEQQLRAAKGSEEQEATTSASSQQLEDSAAVDSDADGPDRSVQGPAGPSMANGAGTSAAGGAAYRVGGPGGGRAYTYIPTAPVAEADIDPAVYDASTEDDEEELGVPGGGDAGTAVGPASLDPMQAPTQPAEVALPAPPPTSTASLHPPAAQPAAATSPPPNTSQPSTSAANAAGTVPSNGHDVTARSSTSTRPAGSFSAGGAASSSGVGAAPGDGGGGSVAAMQLPADNWDLAELAALPEEDVVAPAQASSGVSRPRPKRPRR